MELGNAGLEAIARNGARPIPRNAGSDRHYSWKCSETIAAAAIDFRAFGKIVYT